MNGSRAHHLHHGRYRTDPNGQFSELPHAANH